MPATNRTVTLTLTLLLLTAWAPVQTDSQRSLSTGITGRVTGAGLDNPQYVLSFPSVQELMLQAVDGPLPEEAILAALEDVPVELEHLLAHGLLAETDAGRYRLAYLLLTVDDQHAIYDVAERMGADLASSIASRRNDFDRLLAAHAQPALRDELLFGMVAGFLLNWDGLSLGSELGYRVETPVHPNGDRYLVHSSEDGVRIPTRGLYSGSHTYPGPRASFSTFGDGPSQPRLFGIPDSYTEPVQAGFALLNESPDLLGSLRPRFLGFVVGELNALGELMLAAADSPGNAAELAGRTGLTEQEATSLLQVLETTGYVMTADGRYRPAVPVLTEGDQALVDDVAALGAGILEAWLQANYSEMEEELSGLSPMRNGVAFEVAFSEVWHWVFGYTTRALAERGFYADPYEPGRIHEGFVPLVWASSLRAAGAS